MTHHDDSFALASDAARTLRLMFEQSRADQPLELPVLARRLGLARVQVARQLLVLERLGLVNAERVRLTMAGLVLATRLPACELAARAVRNEATRLPPRRGQARGDRGHARPRRPRRLPAGWARDSASAGM